MNNQVFKYGGQKHWAFVPQPTVLQQSFCIKSCKSTATPDDVVKLLKKLFSFLLNFRSNNIGWDQIMQETELQEMIFPEPMFRILEWRIVTRPWLKKWIIFSKVWKSQWLGPTFKKSILLKLNCWIYELLIMIINKNLIYSPKKIKKSLLD